MIHGLVVATTLIKVLLVYVFIYLFITYLKLFSNTHYVIER